MTNEDIFRLLLVVLFAGNRQISGEEGKLDFSALNDLILVSLLSSASCGGESTAGENTTF